MANRFTNGPPPKKKKKLQESFWNVERRTIDKTVLQVERRNEYTCDEVYVINVTYWTEKMVT